MTKISMINRLVSPAKSTLTLKPREKRERFFPKESGFGPLKSPQKTTNSLNFTKESSTSNSSEKIISNFFKDEKKIQNWNKILKSGYSPSNLELLELQELVYSNLQKIELASKAIQSLQQTMNTLKQTQL